MVEYYTIKAIAHEKEISTNANYKSKADWSSIFKYKVVSASHSLLKGSGNIKTCLNLWKCTTCVSIE